MKLLGHADPEMTMRYVDVALTDLHREFQMARAKPQHLIPQPKIPPPSVRAGLTGVLDSILAAQHVLEMFRRTLPDDHARNRVSQPPELEVGPPTLRPESSVRLGLY